MHTKNEVIVDSKNKVRMCDHRIKQILWCDNDKIFLENV